MEGADMNMFQDVDEVILGFIRAGPCLFVGGLDVVDDGGTRRVSRCRQCAVLRKNDIPGPPSTLHGRLVMRLEGWNDLVPY